MLGMQNHTGQCLRLFADDYAGLLEHTIPTFLRKMMATMIFNSGSGSYFFFGFNAIQKT